MKLGVEEAALVEAALEEMVRYKLCSHGWRLEWEGTYAGRYPMEVWRKGQYQIHRPVPSLGEDELLRKNELWEGDRKVQTGTLQMLVETEMQRGRKC